MPNTMTKAEYAAAFGRSFSLLAAYPLRWLIATVVFLVVVEATSAIPYVGFVVKLSLAGVFARQWMRMFADADAGRPPRLRTFLGAFRQPVSELWPLIFGAVAPFVVGIALLAATGDGWSSIRFFFGHLGETPPPDVAHWLVLKAALYVVGAFLWSIAPVVAFGRGRGASAIGIALTTALRNPAATVTLFVGAVVLEVASLGLSLLPKAITIVTGLALLVVFFAWLMAATYAFAATALRVVPTSHPDVDLVVAEPDVASS